MSERVTIARPYAKAAFVLARQTQKLPQWSDVINLSASVVADERVRPLLNSPRVKPTELVDFICDIGGTSFDSQARNFLGVLAENRRLSYLPEIAQLFAKMRADYERIVDVTVFSAVELSAEQQQRFSAALARRFDRQIRLHTRIDSNLLGGAVVQADDLVIDGSVRGGLAQLATQVAN